MIPSLGLGRALLLSFRQSLLSVYLITLPDILLTKTRAALRCYKLYSSYVAPAIYLCIPLWYDYLRSSHISVYSYSAY